MAMQRHLRVVGRGTDDECAATGLRVAFATTDMKHVDQHFGSARSFAIYAVDPERASMLEAAEFGKLDQDGDEDKLAAKIQMLNGCAAVYCLAIGSSAVRQLVALNVQPVKVSEGASIAGLVKSLQDEMRAGPSAWLAKAIQRQSRPDMNRFDAMESEGWDE